MCYPCSPRTDGRLSPCYGSGSADAEAAEAAEGARSAKVPKVDGSLVAKGVRALLRQAEDPKSISRKELRAKLESKLGVADLSEWKETIKEAAVAFVLAIGESDVDSDDEESRPLTQRLKSGR